MIKKLTDWVADIGPQADEIFVGCALTPRDILRQVTEREPEGEDFVQSFWTLKQEPHAAKGDGTSPAAEQ